MVPGPRPWDSRTPQCLATGRRLTTCDPPYSCAGHHHPWILKQPGSIRKAVQGAWKRRAQG
eukprot:363391-Chlamydomonas_euryale.AAC.13